MSKNDETDIAAEVRKYRRSVPTLDFAALARSQKVANATVLKPVGTSASPISEPGLALAQPEIVLIEKQALDTAASATLAEGLSTNTQPQALPLANTSVKPEGAIVQGVAARQTTLTIKIDMDVRRQLKMMSASKGVTILTLVNEAIRAKLAEG